MLVHRMVKKVKDSKVWAKINTKDESDRLESLKRQLAQAKQTGGDKDYEKELENEIKELEAQYQREGLTKDADPRGYKVSDQIIKGFLIYKSGKGPATFFAKNENGKEFEGSMEEIKKQIDDYWVKQDESVMKQKVRDEDYKGYEITEEEKGFVVRKGSEVKVIVGSVQKAKEYIDRFVTKDALTRAMYMREKDQLMMKVKDASQAYLDGYAAARGAYGKHTNPVKDDPAKAAEWDKGWEDGKADKDELSAKGSGQEFVKYGSHFKDARPKHPRWRIKDDKLFRLRSAIKKAKTKDVEGEIVISMSNMSKYMELKGKGYTVAWVGEGKIAFVPPKPKTKDAKSLSEYKQEHAQLLDALKAEKAKGSPDKAEISGIEKNIAAVVGMISAMMTKDKSIHPRFRIKDDKLFQLRDCLGKLKGRDTYTKGSADRKTKDDYKSMSLEELQDKAKQGYFELQSDPKLRNHVEIKYPNGKREWIFVEKLARDKYTGDPLTAKGRKIMAAMREKYGAKKGKQVFFASRNKGTIKNVDPESKDSKTKDDLFETIRKIRNSSGAIVGTIAIYDAVGEFVVETWNLKSGKDVKKVVKRFPYEGNEDRKAALMMARGFVNTYPDYEFKDSKTKDEAVQMQCNECGKRFKKNITSSTVEVKCPACGGYDTDVDEPAGKVITQR